MLSWSVSKIVLLVVAVATSCVATPALAQKAKPVTINGSSTVYPITQAVAEEFEKANPKFSVAVGESGTTGGFKKFIAGESDINNASRPITADEKAECEKKGIAYLELTVAIDGLTVVVHPQNTWCTCMTVAELKKLWEPDSSVKLWSDIRADWPKEKISLYGAGPDSGTFDYFTEVICKTKKKSRTDYTPSEDDNILVQGVSSNKHSMGYFGYSYYVNNQKKVKALGIAKEEGAKCVKPSDDTVLSGEYSPLSRPLFIYVRKDSLKRPEVAAFVDYQMSDQGQALVNDPSVNYIRIKPEVLAEMRARVKAAR